MTSITLDCEVDGKELAEIASELKTKRSEGPKILQVRNYNRKRVDLFDGDVA